MQKIVILLGVICIPPIISFTTQWDFPQNRNIDGHLIDDLSNDRITDIYKERLIRDRRKRDNKHTIGIGESVRKYVNSNVAEAKRWSKNQLSSKQKQEDTNHSYAIERGRSYDTRTSQMVSFGVDFLLRLVQPFLGTRGLVLSALSRPIFLFLGNVLLTGGVNIVKSLLSKNVDDSLVQEPLYAAYPVYIPGYGSYILLSNNGTLELLNNSSQPESKPSVSDTKDDVKDSREASEDEDEVMEKDKDKEKMFTEKDKKDTSEEDDDDDAKKIKDRVDVVQDDKKQEGSSTNKTESLYLGQTHLIPIVNKPNVFQSMNETKDAEWTDETDETIRECIKQILGTRSDVKDIKKKILINILRRLEYAISNLVR